MNTVSPEFIQKYQELYERDPGSKVFAPLAEAYRKIGMLDEALKISELGVQKHPTFPSGRVALAKVLIDMDRLESAIKHLRAAVEISPENIMAHSLLADCLIKTRQTKEALRAYKMVLFLNPNDLKSQAAVKKLESLTADEWEQDVFELKKIQKKAPKDFLEAHTQTAPPPHPIAQQKTLERFLSLTDAFIIRNDIDRALATLETAENQMGRHPDIEKRRQLLIGRSTITSLSLPPQDSQQDHIKKDKIQQLERWLQRIEQRRMDSA